MVLEPIWFGTAPYESFKEANGTLIIAAPAPGVLCTTQIGHSSLKLSENIVKRANAMFTTGARVTFFSNWSDLQTYETASRQMLTDWSQQNARHITNMHILLKSQLVVIGVRAANLVLGGKMIIAYSDANEFKKAYARATGPSQSRQTA